MFNNQKYFFVLRNSVSFLFKKCVFSMLCSFCLAVIFVLIVSLDSVYAQESFTTEFVSGEKITTEPVLNEETTVEVITEPVSNEETTVEVTTEPVSNEETTVEATTEPVTTEKTITVYTIPENQKINPISLKGKDGYISVKWISSKRYYGFNLYRRIYGKNKWKKIKNIEAQKEVRSYYYNDYKVTAGVRYEYAVIGLNRYYKESGKKSLLGRVYAIPEHAENVKASFISSNSVKIKWKTNPNVSGYYIYRSFDTLKWKKIYTVNSKKKSFVDEIGIENKHCHYRVIPFVLVNNKYVTGTKKIKFATSRSVKGIDVSYHNGRIDWKKVKKSGVDFAFIRVGYGDSSKASGGVLDPEFKRNVKNARKNGIDIGVYLYSTAVNVAQARKEADFVIKSIKDYGEFEYPIVYDFESEYRKRYSCKAENTEMVKTFFEELENAGYTNVTIYSDFNMLYRYLKYKKIKKKYGCWMAYWTYDYDRFPTDKIDNVKFWQYSDKGKIPGIKEDVDLNVRYVTGN